MSEGGPTPGRFEAVRRLGDPSAGGDASTKMDSSISTVGSGINLKMRLQLYRFRSTSVSLHARWAQRKLKH